MGRSTARGSGHSPRVRSAKNQGFRGEGKASI